MAKARIMVVEDEIITAEDLKEGLESLGYIVTAVVSSGEEAVKKAEELKPDLVLMDIKLRGDMDGIEAAEQITGRFGIPIIYLTAYGDADTVQRAKITEPVNFIRKPFEKNELLSAIKLSLYRANLEKKLRNSDQYLSTILKSINEAVIVTDYRGWVRFINPVAENLTGWIKEDAIGEDLMKIFVTTGVETQKDSKRILNKEQRLSTGPFENLIIVSKDGTKIFTSGSINPLEDDSGDINGLVIVFHSVGKGD